MTDKFRRNLILAGRALAAAPLSRAFAQPAGYPNKAIKIMAAAPPGGLIDAYSRLFAEQFTARFNQPAIVDNRPGASGIIATEAMLKAPADGYTLLVTTTGMLWQTRVLFRKLPFDLAKDIAPITVFPPGPLVLAVHEKTGVKNLKELIEYVNKNPSTMASYAVASYPHVFAEALNKESANKIETIQYKGEVQIWIDLAAGALTMAIASYHGFTTVQDKGVRPIAVTGPYRSPKLPDVPTLIEQGMKAPIARLEGGIALSANSAVPTEILDLLAMVAVDGNATPRAKGMRENFAIPEMTKGRADALRMWREDALAWIKETQALGVTLD